MRHFTIARLLSTETIALFLLEEGVEAKYEFFLSRTAGRNRLLPGQEVALCAFRLLVLSVTVFLLWQGKATSSSRSLLR